MAFRCSANTIGGYLGGFSGLVHSGMTRTSASHRGYGTARKQQRSSARAGKEREKYFVEEGQAVAVAIGCSVDDSVGC